MHSLDKRVDRVVEHFVIGLETLIVDLAQSLILGKSKKSSGRMVGQCLKMLSYCLWVV